MGVGVGGEGLAIQKIIADFCRFLQRLGYNIITDLLSTPLE